MKPLPSSTITDEPPLFHKYNTTTTPNTKVLHVINEKRLRNEKYIAYRMVTVIAGKKLVLNCIKPQTVQG